LDPDPEPEMTSGRGAGDDVGESKFRSANVAGEATHESADSECDEESPDAA
jgi:hypothetical protein